MDTENKRSNEQGGDEATPKSPKKNYRTPKIFELEHPDDFEQPDEWIDDDEAVLADVMSLMNAHNVKIGTDAMAGDVIYVDGEEFYLIAHNEEDKESGLRLIRNPDNTGAGFLTIPQNIAKLFPNCVEAYSKLSNVVSCVDIQLSNKDTFITSKLGKLDDKYLFEVALDEGQIDNVSFKYGTGQFNFLERDQLQLLTREFVESVKEQTVFSCICQLRSKEAMTDTIAKIRQNNDNIEDTEDDGTVEQTKQAEKMLRHLEFKLPKFWRSDLKCDSADSDDCAGVIWDVFGPDQNLSEAKNAVLAAFPDTADITLTTPEKRLADRPQVKFPSK